MKVKTLFACCCFYATLFSPPARCQDEIDKSFPTKEEIQLLVTQTDRAVSQYELTINLEEKLLERGKTVENDRKVIHALRTFVDVLTKKPEGFNRVEVFQFVLLLDDASRNSSLCYGEAIQKGLQAVASHAGIADDYLMLAQSCTASSGAFYTVSENAAALYQRFLNGLSDNEEQAFKTMNQCMDALKKLKPAK
jgi:hypothetical protein